MHADPKPARRLVNRRAGQVKVAAEGQCRSCRNRYGLERHHLVPRSLGGDDVEANIVPLCQDCHGTFERQSVERRRVGERIRLSLAPDEVTYILERKGQAFLDRYYPLRG